MNNFFFVITPLQYVNALELKSHLNSTGQKNILVLLSSFNKSRSEIHSMLEENIWDEILTLSKSKAASGVFGYINYIYKLKIRLLRIFEKYPIINNLVIGNYNDVINHFVIQNSSYQELYLLDDGLASFEIAVNRNIEIENHTSILELDRFKKIRPKLAKWIFNLQNRIPEKINFFTTYDLKKNNRDCLIENRYLLLISKITVKKKEKLIYFIGQPLLELKILKRNFYFDILKKLINRYHGYKFYYIPHRTENTEKLKQISRFMDVKRFNVPLEVAIIREEILPSLFITFYSSAIINLNAIYGINFQYKMIKLRVDEIQKNENNILQLYRTLNFDIIKNLELIEI